MTERFDIFIERPTDTSPAGRERLVRAMSSRFGIEDRLLRGPLSAGRRLRAKANVDQSQAAKIVRELEALGAIVTVAKHTGATPRVSQELSLVTPLPQDPLAVGTGKPSGNFAKMPSLTLSTLDGEDAEPAPPPPLSAELTALPPPPPGLKVPSTLRPAAPSPSAARPALPAPSAGDPFAGPNAFAPPEETSGPLELAIQPMRSGTMAAPPPVEPPPAQKPSKAAPAIAPLPVDSAERLVVRPSVVELATRNPRGRFVAGLILGLALGFLPAHLYASFAEEKLDDIGLAMAREPAPQTEAEYQLLMQQFDLAEGRSRRVKARIMVIAGAVWLLGGAGVAYGYWRLMESRLLARSARDA